MSPWVLHMFAIIIALIAGGVFLLAFKFALADATCRESGREPGVSTPGNDDLPRAELHNVRLYRPTNRWHHGASKQRLVRHVYLLQAGLVAFGITAVFVMLICMACIFMAMVMGTV